MSTMRTFFSFLSEKLSPLLGFFGINLLDIVIMLVLLFYAYEGYTLGLLIAGVDLISFILSFIVALKFYGAFGMFLADAFSISPGFARAIGFFILALISEIIINIVLKFAVKRMPEITLESHIKTFLRKFNHMLGIIPGLTSAFIILAFLLSVIISLPSSPILKQLVTTSLFGKHLVANAATFEKGLNDIFGGALNETMNFLTVKPSSDETVDLRFTVAAPTVDLAAEQEMFRLVNKERMANGIDPLTFNNKLRDLARDYSKDMFQRGYFSHYNPEGQSPFDRMDAYGITYGYAGENLALAPSTELAMQGLMNSPGHRENILKPQFTKIGIGAMDGGIYGKMFTQEFTD
jgi:uncharacterized protein YkwD